MKAKKLPSGNWRVQVYSHMENGKKKYVSFTAHTKSEAVRMAAEFADGKSRSRLPQNMTVGECIQKYIESKEAVLSPSTVRSYVKMQELHYKSLENIQIGRLDSKDLQAFVSSLSMRLSPKSVKNIYSLLMSSISMFSDIRYRVTLPAARPPERNIPTDADVALLMQSAGPDLKLCIALAGIGTLRRGEICGLKYGDVLRDFSAVFVHADVVYGKDGKYVYKDLPKNSQSVRRVPLPKEVIDMVGEGSPEEFVYKGSPATISCRFHRLTRRLGLRCRFHDLRHYAASILHAIGVPDAYIMERGGWKTDTVLKSVYRNSLSDQSRHFASVANEHFRKHVLDAEKVSHEISHGKMKKSSETA